MFMKSSLISILYLLILMGVFGCMKDKVEPADYREKYTGLWEMTVINNSTQFTTGISGTVTSYYTDTTIYSDVNINIDESSSDGLIINLNPNNSSISIPKVKLSENGKFKKPCGQITSIINGEFESENSLNMQMHEWGVCNSYSSAGYSDQTVTGVKN